jgi:hypothetical protein
LARISKTRAGVASTIAPCRGVWPLLHVTHVLPMMNQLAEPRPTLQPDPPHRKAAHGRPAFAASRMGAVLRQWWQRLWMDDMTAYLSRAESAVDLEYRIRNWYEHERRGRMPLL